MKRRTLLTSTVAGAAAAVLAAPALAQSRPTVKWRMATSFPKNLDILYGATTKVAQRVAELTDNNFQIATFAAGELVPPLQATEGIRFLQRR